MGAHSASGAQPVEISPDLPSGIDGEMQILSQVPREQWESYSPYTKTVFLLAGEALQIIINREPLYGDSWRGQGIDGLTFSVIEKLRRFWHLVMVKGECPRREETLDMVNFLLFLQVLAEVDGMNSMKVRAVRELFHDQEVGP